MKTTTNVAELQSIAKKIRREIVEMTGAAKSGHPGGSLSAVEIVVTLYFDDMRHDPENPKWADRDRFILSKGHAAPVLYAVMAESGYTPVDQLNTLRKLGSIYQGHPDMRYIPALEASTGSLGEGLSMALGMGLAARLDKRSVPHVRGAGRWRNPGRADLGSGHVRRISQSGQRSRDRGLQRHPA